MGKKLVLQGVDFLNEIPTISPTITLAISNNNITANTTITLTANVLQGDLPIANVKFYFDGVLIEQKNTAPYTTTKAVTSSSNGSKVFYAVATDSNGNTSIRNANSDKTITVAIPLVVLDPATEVYINASGITDLNVINPLDVFVRALKTEGIWSKITNAYPILGINESQIKYNLKNGADALSKSDGSTIPNTINKGIKFESVAGFQVNSVKIPLDQTFASSVANDANSGHAIYFMNEDLVANSVTVSGLALPMSGVAVNGIVQADLFDLSGSSGVNGSSTVFMNKGKYATGNVTFKVKGVFGAIKNATSVSFYGNSSLLKTGTTQGSENTKVGFLGIGCQPYPIDNTISFVSVGNVAMTGAEMITYQNLIKTLINSVHGITV